MVREEKKPFICSLCGKLLRSKDKLRRHIFTHTGEKPFSCHICGKSFSQSNNRDNHLLVHSDEKPHKCTICGKSYKYKQYLRVHMLIHNDIKPHKCQLCGYSTSFQSSLGNHMLIHTEHKPYTCNLCGAANKRLHDFRKHMRKFHRDTYLGCQEVNERIKTKSEIPDYLCNSEEKYYSCLQEVSLHTDDKPFSCDACGMTFEDRSQCRRHMLDHREQKPIICQVCGEYFSSSFDLSRHTKVHAEEESCREDVTDGERHLGSERSEQTVYSCKTCGKPYKTLSALFAHLYTDGSGKSVCRPTHGEAHDVTSSVNKRMSELSSERLKNDDEAGQLPEVKHEINTKKKKDRKTKSEADKLAFTNQSFRSRENDFWCDICNVPYTKEEERCSHILTHMETGSNTPGEPKKCRKPTHTMEKSYTCDTCGQYFDGFLGLKSHIISHLEGKCEKRNLKRENIYTCEKCGDSFASLSSLQSHFICHMEQQAMNHSGFDKTFEFGQTYSPPNHLSINTEEHFRCRQNTADLCQQNSDFQDRITADRREKCNKRNACVDDHGESCNVKNNATSLTLH